MLKRIASHLFWVARLLAFGLEGAWRLLRIRKPLPVSRTAVHLVGREVTVNDAKARRELGYVGRVGRAEGLAEMVGR